MQWTADIVVMPKEGVNDPQGEAILGGLRGLGFESVSRVRAGKRFQVILSADDEERALAQATLMAERLLANPVIESFQVEGVVAAGTPSENAR